MGCQVSHSMKKWLSNLSFVDMFENLLTKHPGLAKVLCFYNGNIFLHTFSMKKQITNKASEYNVEILKIENIPASYNSF